jgi:hypothetical protein
LGRPTEEIADRLKAQWNAVAAGFAAIAGGHGHTTGALKPNERGFSSRTAPLMDAAAAAAVGLLRKLPVPLSRLKGPYLGVDTCGMAKKPEPPPRLTRWGI